MHARAQSQAGPRRSGARHNHLSLRRNTRTGMRARTHTHGRTHARAHTMRRRNGKLTFDWKRDGRGLRHMMLPAATRQRGAATEWGPTFRCCVHIPKGDSRVGDSASSREVQRDLRVVTAEHLAASAAAVDWKFGT
jgi:hypothetical protein